MILVLGGEVWCAQLRFMDNDGGASRETGPGFAIAPTAYNSNRKQVYANCKLLVGTIAADSPLESNYALPPD